MMMNKLLIPVIIGLALIITFMVIGIVDVNVNGFKDSDKEVIGDSVNVQSGFPYNVYYDKDKFENENKLEIVKIENG